MTPMRTCGWSLVALVALTVLPASAQAAWIGLRNDTQNPIIVQTGTVVNNTVAPGRPMTLNPGEVAWDCVLKPCVKCIGIYDSKTKQSLYEKKFPCSGDLFYSVQMNAQGKVILVPAQPPRRR
jgi:hypothetical protein